MPSFSLIHVICNRASAARLLRCLSLSVVALMISGANAQDRAPSPKQDFTDVRGNAAASPECTCRAKGKEFGIGAQICLASPGGTALFTCEMDQNVTSWRQIAGRCPEA